MKKVLPNLNIKKIELPRLEKYIDVLFSVVFISIIVFLGLIFYNQFLPIYNFDAFKSPKVIIGTTIKEDKLNNIINDLDGRKVKMDDYIINKPIKDPFAGFVKR